MGKIILYHGSPDKEIKPAFGLGENRHDYGKGFYLTENIDLQKNGRFADRMRQMAGFINMSWIWKD